MVELANDDQRGDADDGAEPENLVHQVVDGGVADDGPVELGVERLSVGLEPEHGPDHEADHHQPVRPADGAELDHLGVRGELDDHLLEAGDDRSPTVGCRLTQPHDVEHAQGTTNEGVPTHEAEQSTDCAQRDRQGVHVAAFRSVAAGAATAGPARREEYSDVTCQ